MTTKVVNITPNASAEGLRDELEAEAQKNGIALRPLIAVIFEFAARNQGSFNSALRTPRRQKGEHIGATVSSETADKLTAWAKRRKSPRGILCRFILEKALEDKLISKILSDKDKQEADRN